MHRETARFPADTAAPIDKITRDIVKCFGANVAHARDAKIHAFGNDERLRGGSIPNTLGDADSGSGRSRTKPIREERRHVRQWTGRWLWHNGAPGVGKQDKTTIK